MDPVPTDTPTCPHHRAERKSLRSRAIRADRQADVRLVQIPWLRHPNHSPVDRAAATGVVGGGRLLGCGASRERCPLTPEQFDDVV